MSGNSLKVRLVVVVLGALAVPLLWAIVQATLSARESAQRSLDTLQSILRLAEDQHLRSIQEIEKLLRMLATSPSLHVAGDACRELLRREVQTSRAIVAMGVSDTTGRTYCADRPRFEGMDFSDRYWFQEVRRNPSSPALGFLRASAEPSLGMVIALSISLSPPGEPFLGSLNAALAPDALISLAPDIVLPEAATVLVVDRSGTVVATRGKAPQTASLIRYLQGGPVLADGRIHTGRDPAGQAWMVQAATTPSTLGTTVVVGVPYRPWGWLDTGFLWGVLLPACLLILTLLAVWLALERLVTRPVAALIAAMRASRSDGPKLAMAVADGPSDFQELATAFDEVAAQSHEREAALQATLAERDLLIKEIHHRVKNNLQIVTSLLNLRASRLKRRESVEVMREAQFRIKSLAVVHRLIYERDETGDIQLDELLRELTPLVHEASGDLARRVTLELDLETILVSADQATPLALIVTELLSNSAKHAFPDGRDGVIRVTLQPREGESGEVVLTVSDDGVGSTTVPDNDNAEGGLGRTLITMLARQLGGRAEVDATEAGTAVRLIFHPLSGRVRPTVASPARAPGPSPAAGDGAGVVAGVAVEPVWPGHR